MKTYEFTGGKPPPESFPVQGLIEASARVLRQWGRALVYYPRQHEYAGRSVKGYLGLREVASSRFAHREGMPLPVENIALTSGSMQAIELIGRHFITPGDTVITSELCYVGTLRFFRFLGAEVVGIPLDYTEGMKVDELDQALTTLTKEGRRPKLIYVTANHQNPTGAILSLERRQRLVELAEAFAVPIVEDDCYGDIDFEEGVIPPAMYRLDPAENVIFVATFSKILGPGLRAGYFCAPDKWMEAILKERWDAGTSALNTMIIAEYLKENLWSHIAQHIAIIKKKRDVLLSALDETLAGSVEWTVPRGGLFDWLTLPKAVDLKKLQATALKRGVQFTPGQSFHAADKEIPNLRLSYPHLSHEDIREGIQRLAACIQDQLN